MNPETREWFKRHGVAVSLPEPTAEWNSSRNRSPLIVGFSSTTSRGPIAHARMLAQVGLLTPEECQQIVLGLSEIQAEIEAGDFRSFSSAKISTCTSRRR